MFHVEILLRCLECSCFSDCPRCSGCPQPLLWVPLGSATQGLTPGGGRGSELVGAAAGILAHPPRWSVSCSASCSIFWSIGYRPGFRRLLRRSLSAFPSRRRTDPVCRRQAPQPPQSRTAPGPKLLTSCTQSQGHVVVVCPLWAADPWDGPMSQSNAVRFSSLENRTRMKQVFAKWKKVMKQEVMKSVVIC